MLNRKKRGMVLKEKKNLKLSESEIQLNHKK